MNLMYLLDTNHASRIMDGKDAALVGHIQAVNTSDLCLCPIVAGELVFMVEKSTRRNENQKQMDALIGLLHMLDVTEPVAREYGRLKMALVARFGPRARRGRAETTLRDVGVSDNDLWIAAVARHYGATLVSRDGDFQRIGDVVELRRESWLGT